MDIYLFLYDKFVEFEVSQTLLILNKNLLTTVSFERGLVCSVENLKVQADLSIEELDIDKVDVFIIPGGEPKHFIADPKYAKKLMILNKKLVKLAKQGKIIAAICGGPTFLAYAKVLDNIKCTATISNDEQVFYKKSIFTNSDIETHNNIITAKGQAFTEFAATIARHCNIFKTEKEMQEMIDWFRNKKA